MRVTLRRRIRTSKLDSGTVVFFEDLSVRKNPDVFY